MQLGNRITLAGLSLLFLNVAAAQAQTEAYAAPARVEFVDIADAVAGRFFDAVATAADPENPNTLIIRFNTGRDPGTWKLNDFKASTAAFSHTSAMDTITFRIVPPEGYYIWRVTYTQQGSGSIARTGKAVGGSMWVVGDLTSELGTFGTDPDVSRTVELTSYWPVLPVSITTSLNAFATPLLGSATIGLTEAEVSVELAPLNVPVIE
jgi:hypothetical protein